MSESETAKTSFLSLAGELRNRIYELALVSDQSICLKRRGWGLYCRNRPKAVALLRTCRALYEEGISILYGQNEFYFAHPATLECFHRYDDTLEILLHPAFKRIQTLVWGVVFGHGFNSYQFTHGWHQLSTMRQLKTLRICFLTQGRTGAVDSDQSALKGIILHLIEKVPAQCTLKWGSTTSSQKKWAREVLGENAMEWGCFEEFCEVEGTFLTALAARYQHLQGSLAKAENRLEGKLLPL